MLSFAISEVVLAIQFLVCSEPELGEWKKEIHSEQRLIQSHFLEIPFERFFIQFFVHNHRKRERFTEREAQREARTSETYFTEDGPRCVTQCGEKPKYKCDQLFDFIG